MSQLQLVIFTLPYSLYGDLRLCSQGCGFQIQYLLLAQGSDGMKLYCWLVICEHDFLILSDFKYRLYKDYLYFNQRFIILHLILNILLHCAMSLPHERRNSQIARENTTRSCIKQKYKLFLFSGERVEEELIRPAQEGNIYFNILLPFLWIFRINIQSRWHWAVLFKQHYLNAITFK